MRPFLLGLLLLGLTACDGAKKSPQGMQLLEFGTFKKLASAADVQAPGAISGARHAVSKVALIERTTNIVARSRTSFGFRVRMPDDGNGDVVACRAKCIHPRLTDPSTGHSSEVEEWDTSGLSGQEGYIGYTFDNSWEVVPGPWTIQVFEGCHRKNV